MGSISASDVLNFPAYNSENIKSPVTPVNLPAIVKCDTDITKEIADLPNMKIIESHQDGDYFRFHLESLPEACQPSRAPLPDIMGRYRDEEGNLRPFDFTRFRYHIVYRRFQSLIDNTCRFLISRIDLESYEISSEKHGTCTNFSRKIHKYAYGYPAGDLSSTHLGGSFASRSTIVIDESILTSSSEFPFCQQDNRIGFLSNVIEESKKRMIAHQAYVIPAPQNMTQHIEIKTISCDNPCERDFRKTTQTVTKREQGRLFSRVSFALPFSERVYKSHCSAHDHAVYSR